MIGTQHLPHPNRGRRRARDSERVPTSFRFSEVQENCSLTSASARLAQLVEHETLNLRVVGSSPTLGAVFAPRALQLNKRDCC